MTEVYAIEVTAYADPGGTRTLCFCTGVGFTTRPTDTPAATTFLPAAIEAGNFSQFLVDALATDGRSRVGAGEIVLSNADGRLDFMNQLGLDGRQLVVRLGTPGTAYPADWTTLLTGTMEQAEFTWDAVRILLRDRQAEVYDKPYQPAKFAGSNTSVGAGGEAGVEGSGDDLKGKPKPRLRGKAINISPPAVNAGKLTFMVSDKPIQSLDAVYVGGNAITPGTARADLAALQAATVSAGTYDYSLGSGAEGAYFRLGTAPDNVVTCDATEGATAAARTAAQVARQILLDAGISAGDIESASVTALDAANSGVLGIWTGTEERRTGELLDQVLGSVGGFWAITAAGGFYFGRLEAPAGPPVRTIERYELIDSGQAVERLRGRGDEKGLPCWRTVLRYQRNYTVQQGADVFAAVAQTRRNRLAEEWLTVVAEDSAVQTKHPLSPEKQVYTLLDSAADAATEAARVNDQYKVKRDTLRVRVPAKQLRGTELRLGDVWALKAPRFDWAGGKPLRLTGVIHTYSANETILELWG